MFFHGIPLLIFLLDVTVFFFTNVGFFFCPFPQLSRMKKKTVVCHQKKVSTFAGGEGGGGNE